MGMDSMMAVEIQQSLEREFQVTLTAKDIRHLTLARLSELSASKEEPKIVPEDQPSTGIFTGRNTPI
jgi:fatty acid synthase